MRRLQPSPRVAVLTLAVALAALGGCAKRPALVQVSAPAPTGAAQPVPAPAPPPTAQPAPPTVQPAPQPPTPPPTAAPAPAPPPAPPSPREFAAARELQDVMFDFDKYEIRPDAAKVLDANARWMTANPNYLILIEGHCDERGTNEYNLVLGEQRAKAAMNYLVGRGVPASRFTVVSYGEERPVCTDRTDACWTKNRRAHFLVKRQ